MARNFLQINQFAGISTGEKTGLKNSFLWAEKCNYREDPSKLTLLPRTVKVSGSVLSDLPVDADRYSTDTYFYGNAGHIYKRTSAEVWTDIHTVPDSHGNGIKYFGEDGYTYFTSDTVLGRYGAMAGTPQFVDDYFGSQGGVPLNTASLDLEASSSQYATAADSASLSIISDITLEGNFKPESLPAAAAEVTLIAKWDGLSDERSYFFDLAAVSGYFGDGSDGALTISTNTTDAPIDSSCSGTAAAYSLTATNASFAAGQKILIHQSRGTNAGRWERNEIASYTAGTITLTNALTNTYTDSGASQAQVLVLKEYTNVTVDASKTWTAKAWDGNVGGILAFLANGTVTVTGTISANGNAGSESAVGSGIGFSGGVGAGTEGGTAYTGEGTAGATVSAQTSANGNGGGAGKATSGQTSEAGGGGGGNGTAGSAGTNGIGSATVGAGGNVVGTADLTIMVFGGGGGGGSVDGQGGTGDGGGGGGIIFIIGATIAEITGSATANGGAGGSGTYAGGGGGAGGSVLLKAQTATLGSSKVTATGGAAGSHARSPGGAGGTGRIHLDYYTSYTGTTSPTLDAIQDSSLVTNTTYQLKFGVSTDGTTTNQEFLSKSLTADPVTGTWYHWAVAWDASASQAEFFVNGVSIGTATGSKTAIYNSTALAAIGAKFGAGGAATEFFDGKVDDIRIWNDLRTSSEIYTNKSVEIGGSSANLQAYWQVDSTTDDSTANVNTLTLVAAPSYDTADVPFPSPTARQDLDQSLDTSGQTYTLPTSISEAATGRQSFVPAKDPQKSIEVLIAAKGTQTWTLTVHDAQNRTIATATATTGNLPTSGDYEFIFSSVWRPVIGQTYHFHLTVPSGTSTVTTTTLNDLETVDFHTYYQFLVEDDFHPIIHHIDKLCIGNERYLATWDAITYNPHVLTLPSGYRIRTLGIWKEYLAIGVVRGTNIYDYDVGYIFFWDGYNDTYNGYVVVPQGGINAMASGNPLYFVAGYTGDLMKYEGGKPKKIRRMPFVSTKKYVEVAPHGLASWRALLHIGMGYNTDSSAIYQGVYSYGTLHEGISETVSFDYPTSTSITQDTGLKIGLVYPIGSSLMIAWQYGTSYGVDAVKPSNDPFPQGKYQSLITDVGIIYQEKQALTMRGLFKKLATSGDSIKLSYKIDRDSSWTDGTAVTTANAKEARLNMPTKGGRYDEFQMQVTIETTNTTSPEFYGIALENESLARERRV